MNTKQRLDRLQAELERQRPKPRAYIAPAGIAREFVDRLARLASRPDRPGDGDSIMAGHAWALFHGSESEALAAVESMKARARELAAELARQGIIVKSG